jgi:hypothetical protein
MEIVEVESEGSVRKEHERGVHVHQGWDRPRKISGCYRSTKRQCRLYTKVGSQASVVEQRRGMEALDDHERTSGQNMDGPFGPLFRDCL